MELKPWPYRGEHEAKTAVVGVFHQRHNFGLGDTSDITVRALSYTHAPDPIIGRYVFLPYPTTTLTELAAAVLKGEPVGARLADCLIESGAVDVDLEVVLRLVEKGFKSFEQRHYPDRADDPMGHLWHDNFDDIKAEVISVIRGER